MPLKLTTTINKILSVSNHTNRVIINDFCEHIKSNGCSDHHQNNSIDYCGFGQGCQTLQRTD
jgi:hypothetical protein